MGQIAEVIKYEGDNSTFIWKHPCEDFNSLTQLIVHESQEAIFMMNGQALDLFGAGRHTLQTQNLPGISKFFERKTNSANAFHCEVYFINKTVQMGIKWGTDSKVRFLDPTLGIPLEIGACGEMNLMVSDSRKLLLKMVGTMNGISWEERGLGFTKSIQQAFRPLISTAVKTYLSSSIKENNINILEIDENLEKLSAVLRKNIIAGFEEYGLSIPQFYITNVLLPEDNPQFKRMREFQSQRFDLAMEDLETTKLKKIQERELLQASVDAERKRLSGFADADIMRAQGYTKKDEFQRDTQIAFAEGLGKMGANGGGGLVGDLASLGVGMAAMGTISSQMSGMFNNPSQAPAQNPTPQPSSAQTLCPNCNNPIPENAKFCLECGTKIVPAGMIICPECGNSVVKGKFCPECGHKFITTCPKCGAETKGGKFCLECGEKL